LSLEPLEDRLVPSGWVDTPVPSSAGSYGNQDYAVAADAAGNVFATGTITQTTTFGAFTLTPGDTGTGTFGPGDVWVARMDGNGNFLWAERIGGAGTDRGFAVRPDGSGNVYVAGFFEQRPGKKLRGG